MCGRLVAAFLIIALLMAGVGCWDRRDPEMRGYVLATAFDYDPDRELYQITVQIAHVMGQIEEAHAGGNPDPGEPRPFWVLSAYGETPFHAREHLVEGTSRELFWGHNIVTVFSEELARSGLRPVLDFLERERQLRLISRPLVVQGDVRKLMEAEFPLEDTGARGLQRQITAVQFDANIFPAMFLSEVYNQLEQPGFEILIGRAEVLVADEEGGSHGEDGNDDDMVVPPVRLGGAAAFVDDVFRGWFEPDEIRGWHLVGGEHQSSYLVPSPGEEGATVGLETISEKARMYPVVEGDEVGINIELKARTRIQEYTGDHEILRDDQFIDSLRRRSAEALRADIEKTISRSQELGSDVLGLGNLIYRKKPHEWWEIEDDWDEIFPELEVNIDVQVVIKRAGLIGPPVQR